MIRTPTIRDPEVDKEELEQVLATYRQLYQRSRQDAEKAVQSFSTAKLPQRDDVAQSPFATALDWDNEAA